MTAPPSVSDSSDPLRSTAIVHPTDRDALTADVVIIGSGMGGSTLAWALKDSGLSVLVVERGRFLPREPENASVEEMFVKKRYKTAEPWFDGHDRHAVRPRRALLGGRQHQVLRSQPVPLSAQRTSKKCATTAASHQSGRSAMTISSPTIARQKRSTKSMAGQVKIPPNHPGRATFPVRRWNTSPPWSASRAALKRQGLHPFHMACGMNVQTMDERRAVKAADGLPIQNDAKSEAENRALRPALRSGNVPHPHRDQGGPVAHQPGRITGDRRSRPS